MHVDAETRNGDLLVAVREPRIDAAVAVQFKDVMRKVTQGGPTRVILDLSMVDFLDSSGLGALVAAMKALGPSRRLDLLAPTPTVQKVFRLTRMDTVFAIYPDEASAFGAGDLVRAG